jgi:ABC-type nickel/cobalt efflux system permease component RcnA
MMSRTTVYKIGLYVIVAVVLLVLFLMNATRSMQHVNLVVEIGAAVLVIWVLLFAILGLWSKALSRSKTTQVKHGNQSAQNPDR